MISIFSLPKPFTNPHVSIIQRNAIKSWILLNAKPQIFLFGNEQGIKEICEEYQIKHVPKMQVNDYGTPLLDSAFNYIEKNAEYNTIMYINADIILFPDFVEKLKIVGFKRFLIVGHRWNIDVNEILDFKNQNCYSTILERALKENNSSGKGGSDYFIFKKGSIKKFPPFAVGRPVWDNWMIYYFLKNRIPVIDASEHIHVIHQNHDYKHVKSSNDNLYWGKEAEDNIELIGFKDYWHTLDDTTYIIQNSLIRKIPIYHWWKIRPGQFKKIHPILFKVYNFIEKMKKYF